MPLTPEQKALPLAKKQAWLRSLRKKCEELNQLRKKNARVEGLWRAKVGQHNELKLHIQECHRRGDK